MDFETQRRYYNLCSPREFLEAGDARYVPIDELGDESHRVRGEDWSGKLVQRIKLAASPVCDLLTGLPGSGKSTELRRVAQQLAEDGYLPVVIDAEEILDLASPIDVPDLVIAILYEAERAVLTAEGKDPEKAGSESFLGRIKSFFSGITLEAKIGGEVDIPAGPKLALEMKYQPALRDQVRRGAAQRTKKFLEEVRDELVALDARATASPRQSARGKGLVVIFDSLEKLRGLTTNYDEVLQSAERIFQGGAPHLQLPVHALYTVPAELISRRRFETIEIMPMIKLQTRDGHRFAGGFDAARRIALRRIPLPALQEILGERVEERLEQMIAWSGGYPRELVRMLQSTIASARYPLSDHAFNRVINEIRDQYAESITTNSYAWLAQVALDKVMPRENDAHHKIADSMLANNAILRYLNDSAWFDLHPAVRQLPGVKQEIEKLERSRRGE
jgi:hypothetical protein